MKRIKSILLVDDDSINNFINEKLIKRLNVTDEVKIVLNGEEALNLLQEIIDSGQKCPELILLDINMPVMDGFEFLEAYKTLDFPDKKSVVIVMLTTSTNPLDIKKLNDSGVFGYVNKPLTDEKFSSILNEHFIIN